MFIGTSAIRINKVTLALFYSARTCHVESDVRRSKLHQGWTQTSLYLQVIHFTSRIPEVMFFETIYIPRTLNTGTCLRQGDLFYSTGLHRNHVLATANTGEIGRGFGKNAGELPEG